ncbi:MAG: trypsin-like peptidase domain-containing protein [Rhodospirillales bacterium]|nr:trypsin-like peptidase domain-containing protein [Rhodospirillales bacterium]
MATPTQAASTCDKSYREAFEQIAPSVVRIFSVAIDPFSLTERVRLSVGSGLVIDDAGNVVTNAHIVYEAREIMISIDDDDMRKAELVGIDPITDLAIVRLKDRSIRLTQAALGNSDEVQTGEQVLAVGYPFGLGKTATQGIISGIKRLVPFTPMSWLTPLIQTDAAVSPGNSGGPLSNLCGEVLGINTLAGEKGQNINFAVPVNLVRELAPQLLEHGRVVRAWHGIHGRLVPPVLMFTLGIAPGFMIETVEPGSPAEKIGLRGGSFPVVIGVEEYLLGGDVISRVNGEPLENMDTVVRIAKSLKVGDTLSIEYSREGAPMTAEVTLPERPSLPGDVRRFRH